MNAETIESLDKILANGLVSGRGDRTSTFCAQEAVCAALGLPITNHPECVDDAVSAFGRRLNDARWSSTAARAKGMRDFVVAQVGSKGAIDSREFVQRLALRTIREVLPLWLRHAKIDVALIAACESAETLVGARDAVVVADAAVAAAASRRFPRAESRAAYAASKASLSYVDGVAAADVSVFAVASGVCDAQAAVARARETVATAVVAASNAANADDVLAVALPLSARIATEILRDLGSPGAQFLPQRGGGE